ncbi:MAG TPA: molybdate ABC transporter substrate-binding protein [Methanothrix sp.]|jgi:molybdate transport system substrate-binding protein|nr:molybdate ABC transporter substrate-binding protein [Methanothrix sp.]HNT73338.1 molybdate ABC transporter substrate-binding protein [Methanothrix sp.]HOI70323.1 molybdate ABC transporter substrate-binding protein [Methanothrix sp.]HPY73288.1 molybdate ABC transporter substrate-binding protein [Methanothrix sp.]HQA63092.1 molybdate ABC transporter substrate-binding protein [Methanothrix sp.]
MNRKALSLLVGLILVAGLVVSGSAADGSLLVYCGAGMSEPMEEIADLFEEREGVEVQYTFGGSAQLLSQIELYQTGDLYMPGARSDIESAIEKGFVDETRDVVYHVPCIVTPKGNPAGIDSLECLAEPGVRVALGDPTGPAIGKVSKKILESLGIWDEVGENVVAFSGTVNELLVYVSLGQADAAIVWEDLFNPDEMEMVEIPREKNEIKVVSIGTLIFSEDKEVAERFMNFVVSEEGKEVFVDHGFVAYPDPKYEG